MKTIALILCCLIFSAHSSFSQQIKKENITIQKPKSTKSHTITVEYPLYNQAMIRNLLFEIINPNSENPKIKVSGKIKNMLKRELINAAVIIECSGEKKIEKDELEETTANPIQSTVTPRRIERKKNRLGSFFIEFDYTEDITSCVIDITWQGKKDK